MADEYMAPKKIVVGMSGGVDSAMAALVLKKDGWEPVGISLWLEGWEVKNGKIAKREKIPASIENAKEVCKKLGIEHHILDVREDFEKKVVSYFLDELKKGRTPNPCLVCNPKLKFAKLIEWADANGIGHVASGHYAKVAKKEDGKFGLFMAADESKDQTYGLCMLKQEQVARIILPLGKFRKEEIFEMAKKEGFAQFSSGYKQSQDLCFIANKFAGQFLSEKANAMDGEIVDEAGRVIGRHGGICHYTVGQRRGLGIGGGKKFVKEIDCAKNRVVVSDKIGSVMGNSCGLGKINFIGGKICGGKILARIRHGGELCEAELIEDGGNEIIGFDKMQILPPGQYCAFYLGRECVGGAIMG